ncbi:MAG: phosphate ABC transporter ATP-binding protein [Methanobrevibacter sp.]|uniref:phosphate ABC transporter ATP-binding protein PstB n=1 Tax=Methanobrevibacter sp. TaxID=66852 RepID=UPI0025CCDC41|nr:phosphate ABC transporter ATP-binding protein PstB [Methanobrevibacter sp.]MBR0270754.1 phosphate ABC transporter ATP-binding protein [Methanobrevibacter sp.]
MKITVKDFNVNLDDKHILNNINLNIKRNSIHAIIGSSGCGKSTFIKSINRMNDLVKNFKSSGKILLDGKNIYDDDIDVVNLRKRVGMVFQKANPFAKSIFDNVAYGLRIAGCEDSGYIKNTVLDSLDSVGLLDEVKDKLYESAFKLSGGQQQRLCIARTIAISPEVILMDEPCSALDPLSTLKVEELINELKDEYTIVLVTHNMQQARRISDYTSFFLDGVLVENGRTEDIFSNPKCEKTENYIAGRFG